MPRTLSIANPIAGGRAYMTARRALDFQRRGLAVIKNGVVVFTEENQRTLEGRLEAEAEQEFLRNRKGIVFWHGSEKNKAKMHRPGKVRS